MKLYFITLSLLLNFTSALFSEDIFIERPSSIINNGILIISDGRECLAYSADLSKWYRLAKLSNCNRISKLQMNSYGDKVYIAQWEGNDGFVLVIYEIDTNKISSKKLTSFKYIEIFEKEPKSMETLPDVLSIFIDNICIDLLLCDNISRSSIFVVRFSLKNNSILLSTDKQSPIGDFRAYNSVYYRYKDNYIVYCTSGLDNIFLRLNSDKLKWEGFYEDNDEYRWEYCGALINDKIYIIGGATGSGSVYITDVCLEYSLTNNEVNKFRLPSWFGRKMGSAVCAAGKNIFIWGGSEVAMWNEATLKSDGTIFNTSEKTWIKIEQVTDAPSARIFATCCWTGKDIIVWGGYNGRNEYQYSGSRYNIEGKNWVKMGDINNLVDDNK